MLATGGRVLVTASTPAPTEVLVELRWPAAGVASLSPVTSMPGSTSVIVRGLTPGPADLEITAEADDTWFSIEVADLDRVELDVGSVSRPPGSDIAFLVGTNELEVHLLSPSNPYDGRRYRLVDDSLRFGANTSAQLKQTRWDVVGLPDTAGTYALTIESDAIGALVNPITLVNAVDAIVAETPVSSGASELICFHAQSGGQLVMTAGWSISPTTGVTLGPSGFQNCRYYHATADSQIVAEVAGIRQTFDVMASP